MSIKNVERHRRSRGQITFNTIVSTAEIKQFGLFLSSNDNKNALIKFIVSQWKKESYRAMIGEKEFLVTEGQKVIHIRGDTVSEEVNLFSNHEEADTRMILHAKHAASTFNKVLIASPNTDVFIILLSLHTEIDARIYFLTGYSYSRRIIDVTKVADQAESSLNPHHVSKELLIKSFIGIHSFTGCDTISSFAGRGKVKPLVVMVKDVKYVEAFAELGSEASVSSELIETLEVFTCHMYGGKNGDVNEMRFQMYCQSGGKIGCEYLPPCKNVLTLHILRANYQAHIWRKSLDAYQNDIDPQQHGWSVDENGDLEVNWMTCSTAPEEVLVLVSCGCKKKCADSCPCISNSLHCTEICGCGDCGNVEEIRMDDDDEYDDSDSLSENDDENEDE